MQSPPSAGIRKRTASSGSSASARPCPNLTLATAMLCKDCSNCSKMEHCHCLSPFFAGGSGGIDGCCGGPGHSGSCAVALLLLRKSRNLLVLEHVPATEHPNSHSNFHPNFCPFLHSIGSAKTIAPNTLALLKREQLYADQSKQLNALVYPEVDTAVQIR